ncbi:MAG: c-type cytochrome [Gammaproteobacteria bacterium]
MLCLISEKGSLFSRQELSVLVGMVSGDAVKCSEAMLIRQRDFLTQFSVNSARRRYWQPAISLLLLLMLASCGETESVVIAESTFVDQLRQNPLELARGEALYQGSCAQFCHAAESGGAADLFDCSWVHGQSDEEIFAAITDGIPDTGMVGFGSNFPEGEDDTWRLVAYIREQQPGCD